MCRRPRRDDYSDFRLRECQLDGYKAPSFVALRGLGNRRGIHHHAKSYQTWRVGDGVLPRQRENGESAFDHQGLLRL